MLNRIGTLRLLGLAVLCGTLAACGSSPQEKALVSQLELMEEATEILEDVKDDASAKAASAKIKELGNSKKAEVAEKMPELSAEETTKLREKYAKRSEEVGNNFRKQIERIMADPVLAPHFDDIPSNLFR